MELRIVASLQAFPILWVSPSQISKPSSSIRREFQFFSVSLNSPSSRQFIQASRLRVPTSRLTRREVPPWSLSQFLPAAPGFAYAVKPMVGTPSFFVLQASHFPELLPSKKSKPSSLIRREFQFSSVSFDSSSSRQFSKHSPFVPTLRLSGARNLPAVFAGRRFKNPPKRVARTLKPLVGALHLFFSSVAS